MEDNKVYNKAYRFSDALRLIDKSYACYTHNGLVIVYRTRKVKQSNSKYKEMFKILFVIDVNSKRVFSNKSDIVKILLDSKELSLVYPYIKDATFFTLNLYSFDFYFYFQDYSFENLPYWYNLELAVNNFVDNL